MFSKDLLDASEQKLLIQDTDVVVHLYRFSKITDPKLNSKVVFMLSTLEKFDSICLAIE